MAFSEPVDINVDHPEDYTKVTAVETDIYMLLGSFARDEMTTYNKRGQITSQSYDIYYVMPIFAQEDIYYVGILVNSEESAPYNRISELSRQYLSGDLDHLGEEVIDFQGGFIKMKDEIYEQFQNWFIKRGYFNSEEELNGHVLPLVLETVNYERVRITAFVMAGAFLISVVLLIFGFRSGGEKTVGAANKVITINGTSYPSDNLEDINRLIRRGKTDKAVKELRKLANISEAEAAAVIQRWDEYWGSK